MKPWKIQGPKVLKLLRPEIEKLPFTKVIFNEWDLIGKGSSPEKAYLRKTGRIQVASAAERSSYNWLAQFYRVFYDGCGGQALPDEINHPKMKKKAERDVHKLISSHIFRNLTDGCFLSRNTLAIGKPYSMPPRGGLPSLGSKQAHRGSRLDRKAKIEKGAHVSPFSFLAHQKRKKYESWVTEEFTFQRVGRQPQSP